MENFGLIVEFLVKPECLHRFNELLAVNARSSVAKEAGCRQFDVLRDVNDPCRVVLYEVYDSPEAFDVHRAQEHTKTFLAAAKELVTKQTAQRRTRTLAPTKQ